MNLHEHLASDSPHGYFTLRQEDSLEAILNNAFAIGAIQADNDLRAFAPFVRDVIRPANILELGTLCGGMLYLMDRMAQPGLRISVDRPWEERDPKPRWPPHQLHEVLPNLQTVEGDIHDAGSLERVLALLAGELVDLLFIDADHSYYGTKRHFEMYGPLVRPGGWIAMHDTRTGWPCGAVFHEHPAKVKWETFDPDALMGIGALQV